MDGRSYFLLITDDSRIAHQRLHVFLVELRDLGKGELREGFLEIRPLVLDHGPAESGCEDRFGQSFKIFGIVFRRFHTPRRHVTRRWDLRYLCAPLVSVKSGLLDTLGATYLVAAYYQVYNQLMLLGP